ncbi:carboxylate-amine ligase [Streptomyces sp. NPDC001985]|uniref:carboxylate-amine ligase n=1 Tax=Streptomyces sp. NPDC001985 TaxID=3154406 RepID=UPI00332AD534
MTATGAQIPALGVEEEYLLVAQDTGAVMPGGTSVLRRAAPVLGDLVSGELTEYQIEAKTPPCTSLPALTRHLARMRAAVAAAAAAEGLRAVATGTPVLGAQDPVPLCGGAYNQRGAETYRGLNDTYALCALHIHVDVPTRDDAVLVGNHLRPWLPTLVALAANSPFWCERDSGYASWRTISAGTWPVSGPPPYFTSGDHYRTLTAELCETGAADSEHRLYWAMRPSTHLPTLEIRAMDVSASIDEVVTLAALVRALVVVALPRVRGGDPGPPLGEALLRAAYWRSARDGLTGQGFDPLSRRLVPATRLVEQLLEHVRPVLADFGDLPQVTSVLHRLSAHGGGAERQRAVYARRSRLHDVVDQLVRDTARVPGSPPAPVTAPQRPAAR